MPSLFSLMCMVAANGRSQAHLLLGRLNSGNSSHKTKNTSYITSLSSWTSSSFLHISHICLCHQDPFTVIGIHPVPAHLSTKEFVAKMDALGDARLALPMAQKNIIKYDP
ncbi:hypothetical protein B0H13DRAFT_2370575 [Mycena leptocephala]|nr:hypothetical protein B0H13DRAFT_2370575 [Mycena leptocephala]